MRAIGREVRGQKSEVSKKNRNTNIEIRKQALLIPFSDFRLDPSFPSSGLGTHCPEAPASRAVSPTCGDSLGSGRHASLCSARSRQGVTVTVRAALYRNRFLPTTAG